MGYNLVGGLEHGFYFPFHIWDVILPIDELIFLKMVSAPPTSYSPYYPRQWVNHRFQWVNPLFLWQFSSQESIV